MKLFERVARARGQTRQLFLRYRNLSRVIQSIVWLSPDKVRLTVSFVLGASMIFQPLLTIRSLFQAELLSKYVFAANNLAFVVATLARVMLILYRRPLVEFAWISVTEIFVMGVSMWSFFHYEGRHVTA